MVKRRYKHKLCNVDEQSRQADCSHCGPNVAIRLGQTDNSKPVPGRTSWRCRSSLIGTNAKTSNQKRHARQELVKLAKNKPCADCGILYPFYVMDLDHVRGTKLFALARAHQHSIQEILNEIEKCDAVCANCHRLRTYGRFLNKKAFHVAN